MKTCKQIGFFLLLGVLLLGLLISGCDRRLDSKKESAIAKIDERLAEIRMMEPEYGLTVIEYEAERSKELIRNATQDTHIQTFTDTALKALDSLLLSEEELRSIKKACSVQQNGGAVSNDIVSLRQILYYLGKIGDYSVAIVKDDVPMILPISGKCYLAAGYSFEYPA